MNDTRILFEDWGLMPYRKAYERQILMFEERIATKQSGMNVPADVWVFCEHSPVITLGRHGNPHNLLFSPADIERKGVEFVATDRGGDITFHGPGQCVCYPIFDLERLGIGLKQYVDRLEQVVIDVLSEYGIDAGRLAGASGVWIEPETAHARKICAVGIRSSRYITMHGIALNVNTELSYFSLIHPCGFVDKGVTSMAKETGRTLEMDEVKERIKRRVEYLFSEKNGK